MRAGSRHAPATSRGSAARDGGPRATACLDVLERLVEPLVSAGRMDLEEVKITQIGRRRVLRVVVDASGGVGLDDMALVSQALSAELDATGIMGEAPYTLEVTSPGVDRPLTEPRHWRRSVGHLVRVAVTGQTRGESAGYRGGEPADAGRADDGGGQGGGPADVGPPGRGGGRARDGSSHADDGGGRADDGDGRVANRDGRVGGSTRQVVCGRVISADDHGVILDIAGERRGFGFADLGSGKVQVEFRRDDMGESRGY